MNVTLETTSTATTFDWDHIFIPYVTFVLAIRRRQHLCTPHCTASNNFSLATFKLRRECSGSYSGKRNVKAEWLTILLRIWEVSGSNFGSETDYSYREFSWFSSVNPGKFRDCTFKLDNDRFLPDPLQFIILSLDAAQSVLRRKSG
jgi:hypothetical protein